jgi:TRAP-type C4-dicarboxylate transport system substrate-binding protein
LNAIFRFAGTLVLGLSTTAVAAQDGTVLKVLGQPAAAGPIQKNKEQPFFEGLAATTGLPIRVEYIPLGSPEFANTDPLEALHSGAVQIAALRVSQAGRAEPSLLGLDLLGLNTDYKVARQVSDAYLPALDRRLQGRVGVKLIGPWPFGPEVLFCSKPVAKLSDIKGRKVRVYDPDSAKLVDLAEGTPIQLGFAATLQALSSGAVDCAIGSPTAAVAAGWPHATTHVLSIALQMGINAYGVAVPAWSRLQPAQQTTLASALQRLSDDIWTYSEELADQAIACSIGARPCESGDRFGLTKVPAADADQALVRRALREASFPRWAQACDAEDPGCSALWTQAVGGLAGIR